MHAKVFDPFSEDEVNAWLTATPVKVIYSANVFDTKLDGHARQVALVFYEEEQALGGHLPSVFGAAPNPYVELMGRSGSDSIQRARDVEGVT